MSAVRTRSSDEVTRLLGAAQQGDHAACEALLELVYDELRALAARHLRPAGGDPTLQPTALVHEAFLKLGLERQATWQNRAHFFGACAQAMRRILVEHARRRGRLKRGGDRRRVALAEPAAPPAPEPIDLLALDEALGRLAALDPTRARIVELRYFGGMTLQQTAACLGLSVPTVTRGWRLAKAWLYRALAGDDA